jgi:DNA-binding NarL/FixJ family response regulator
MTTTAIRPISKHPLFIDAVEKILAGIKDIQFHALPAITDLAEATRASDAPTLFILDACPLQADLGPRVSRCRANSPSSKFLAVLSPMGGNHAEKIQLFYWGIDGFVELHKSWQAELPLAIRSILNGDPWVPPEVLMVFVKQVKTLLDMQLQPGQRLTTRESEVLQLLMRRLSNKEISRTLTISGRTVKFHVANILAKLNIEDRSGLLPEKIATLEDRATH